MAFKKVCDLYVNAESQTFPWSLLFGDQGYKCIMHDITSQNMWYILWYMRDMSKFVSLLNKELLY